MFLYILHEVLHSQHPSARIERAILWTSPFGYYVVSLAILAEHSSALLVFLVLLSFVGVVVSVRVGAWLRLVFWLAAAAPLLVWSGLHGNRTWLVAGLAAWIAVYVLNLAGLLEGTLWKGRRFAGVDIVLLHLSGLALYAGAYLLVDPVHPSVSAPLAAALASMNGVIAIALIGRFRDEAIHFAALAFTLLTIAIGLQLDGAWITSAWAAEGAVVIWLGLRERREWLRAGGAALFGVAIGRLLTLQFSPAPVGEWPLLNERALCGVFVIALTYAITWVHRRDREGSDRATEVGIGLLLAKLLLLALAASETLSF